MKNPYMVFTTRQIARLSFRELAERAMVKAAKGQRGAAKRIVDHDMYEKVRLEQIKLYDKMHEAQALVEDAIQALDSDK